MVILLCYDPPPALGQARFTVNPTPQNCFPLEGVPAGLVSPPAGQARGTPRGERKITPGQRPDRSITARPRQATECGVDGNRKDSFAGRWLQRSTQATERRAGKNE